MTALLLLLFSYLPIESVAVDSVDSIEVNHFYDEQGKHVFDQIILWKQHSAGPWQSVRLNVVSWRMLKSTGQFPLRDQWRGGHTIIWHDGDTLRKVRATSFKHSWTQHDPEVSDRELLPPHLRLGLSDELRIKHLQPPVPE